MRNTQTTTWTNGVGSATGCKPGAKSRYQENLYFVTDIQVQGGKTVSKGIKRSVGGDLGRYEQSGKWDWDTWFHEWRELPDNLRDVHTNESLTKARPDSYTRMAEGLKGAKGLAVNPYIDQITYAGKRPYYVMKIASNSRQLGDSLRFADLASLKSYVSKEVLLGAKKFRLCISARAPVDTASANLELFDSPKIVSVTASDSYATYCGDAILAPKQFSDQLAPFVDASTADLLVDSMSVERSE